jgi:hypothetical protein
MRVKCTWVGAILAGMLLVGCGSPAATQSTVRSSNTATAVPPPTPTATQAATPLPTADPAQAAAACRWNQGLSSGAVHVGDLFISRISLGLANPDVMLPDGTPLKPLQVQTAISSNAWASGSFTPPPAMVNPALKEQLGSFDISICNGSPTQSHVVQGTSIRIDTQTPYSGQLNVWKSCTVAYSRQQPGGAGGCGGGYAGEEYLHATFASGATAGAVAAAVQTNVGAVPGNHGPLPVTLAHGSTLELSTGLTLPSAPAMYTFSLGITVDGATSIWLPVSGSMLFAPVAHVWSGVACAAPTMQSQIPAATNPPSYYICPA